MTRSGKGVFALLSACAILAAIAAAIVYAAPTVSFQRSVDAEGVAATIPPKPVIEHISTPPSVKAIYMTQCVAGTPSLRDSLVKLIETTGLNAIVIDIRDYTGTISFPTDDPLLKDYVSKKCGAPDMKEFIKMLHEKNIYVIGRITTFQNPAYAKAHPDQAVQKIGGGVWHDFKGLAFIDVGAKPYWETVVKLGKISYDIGFDELNFDYLRFPSDGPMKEADYSWDKGKTKAEALEEFYRYLYDSLKSYPRGDTSWVPVISADLFGYVTVHTDDLGIGQVLESAMPYFDYIDPMVYPSHYNSGFEGLKNVNSDPYRVVYASLKTAVARAVATTTAIDTIGATLIASTSPQLYEKSSYEASKIRAWLQAFDYPVPYTPEMVAAQIKANEDVGLDSYLMWDAANKYTSLRKVLVSSHGTTTENVQ